MKLLGQFAIALICLQILAYPGQVANSAPLLPNSLEGLPKVTLLANVDPSLERTNGDALGEYNREYDADTAVERVEETDGQLQRVVGMEGTTVDGALDDSKVSASRAWAIEGEGQRPGNTQAGATEAQAKAQIETREKAEVAQQNAEAATDRASAAIDNTVEASQAQIEATSEKAKQEVSEDIDRAEAAKAEAGSRLEAAAAEFSDGFRNLFGQPDKAYQE